MSGKKNHRENTVGAWAKQKLDALESYLIAYQNVMSKQPFRTVFIDAFAGAGSYEIRGAHEPADDNYESLLDEDDLLIRKEFIEGSPRRALGLKRKFHSYRFVDLDPHRVGHLEALVAEYGVANARVVLGDANAEVQKIAAQFGSWDLRGFAFLDPYGAHLHWDTLRKLAETKKFDVIINCPIHMAIDRLVKRDGDISDRNAKQLDNFFGTREWYEVSYGTSEDLFGPGSQFKRADAASRQLNLYVQRLRGIFSHVSRPSLVRNSRGHPLYYLIWAGEHGRGAPIAEHILGLGSKVTVPRRKTEPR